MQLFQILTNCRWGHLRSPALRAGLIGLMAILLAGCASGPSAPGAGGTKSGTVELPAVEYSK